MSTISSSAICKMNAATACAKIISSDGLKAWWIGKVEIKECDNHWAATGTRMTWKADGGIFKARVIQDARPQYVEMEVSTPGADSIIRHTFEALDDGSTRYTKSVIPKWRSAFAKFISPLLNPLIGFMVSKEVKRAASFAEQN